MISCKSTNSEKKNGKKEANISYKSTNSDKNKMEKSIKIRRPEEEKHLSNKLLNLLPKKIKKAT